MINIVNETKNKAKRPANDDTELETDSLTPGNYVITPETHATPAVTYDYMAINDDITSEVHVAKSKKNDTAPEKEVIMSETIP